MTSSCTETRAVPADARALSSRPIWCMGTFHQSAYSATSAMVLAPVPPITMGSRSSGVGSCRAPVTSKCVP